jgi:hypothetical protein
VADHLLTIIAYAAVALLVAWWFWRTQAGVINQPLHAAVSIIFGLLWPLALPWHVCVHAVSRAIAKYRLRRLKPSADEQVIL